MNFHFLQSAITYKFKKTDENQWFFTSFGGGYSDNPKALSEYVHMNYPSITQVWAVKKEKMQSLPSYVVTVELGSKEYYQQLSRSKIVIDNVWGPNFYRLYRGRFVLNFKNRVLFFLFKKKKQNIYTMWHGTPLKKMDQDQQGNDCIKGSLSYNLTMFVGNYFTQKIMYNLSYQKVKTLSTGMPRNDVLFEANHSCTTGIPSSKHVLLYAPTFRNDGVGVNDKSIERSGLLQLTEINFNLLFEELHKKFGGDWVFVCRFHYHVSKMVDWDLLENKYPGSVINGNAVEDMAEYLSRADILLTDASSAMFDFSLTGKPCFLFFPDFYHYKNVERGFYWDLCDLPYSLALNFSELINNIRQFDFQKYTSDNQRMLNNIGNSDNGNASKTICEYILRNN